MTDATTQNAPLSVFITGATGALARAVTRQLHAAGHHVTGTTSRYENAAFIRKDGGIPAYPDLLRAGELRSVMQAAKTDVVINLAPQHQNHLPQQAAKWNTERMDEGVEALLEAAEAVGVQFVIHSSYAFAGEELEALGDFLEAVRAGEDKVLKGNIPGCVLRFGFLYGAESPELVRMRTTLMMGKTVDAGPDDTDAWWIDVADAASAVMRAVDVRPAGALLNVVEDQPVAPAAFLRYFAESQGVSAPVRPPRYVFWAQPTNEQLALMSLSPHVSNAETKEKLSWSPRFASYREAVDDIVLSWRAATEVGSTAT